MKYTNATMQVLWPECSEGWANYKSWKLYIPFTKKIRSKILLSVTEARLRTIVFHSITTHGTWTIRLSSHEMCLTTYLADLSMQVMFLWSGGFITGNKAL